MSTTIEDQQHLQEIFFRFRTPLPSAAMKPIKATKMIDIDDGECCRRLNNEFGLCGWGWYYEGESEWVNDFKPAHGEQSVTTPGAVFMGKLYYRIPGTTEWSKPLPMVGGCAASSEYALKADVLKGARTNALTKTCGQLFGIGWEVYSNRLKADGDTIPPLSPDANILSKFAKYVDDHGMTAVIERHRNLWGVDEGVLRLIMDILKGCDEFTAAVVKEQVGKALQEADSGKEDTKASG